MNSHSSLFHSKYDPPEEEDYAIPVAEFPTKEKPSIIQQSTEGAVKQSNAKDRILFNGEAEEFSLGLLDQDKHINVNNQRTQDKEQEHPKQQLSSK